MELEPHIAREIRAEMVRQGVTVAELASRTNVPLSTLYSWLGRKTWNTDQLVTVARALGITASDIIARVEQTA